MSKIAVDVALLLPEKINKICIELNRNADATAFSDFSKNNNHPHITLAMGVIDKNDLSKAEMILVDIISKFPPLELEIIELYYKIKPETKKRYSFEVRLTKELKKLHKMIMKELIPFFSYDVDKDMFFLDSDENFNEISKYWVENYGKKHFKSNNYHPHISLKCRKAEYNNFPVKFTASKLVICQLGDYCTCRKILADYTLKSQN